ncbi:DNA-binding protein [Breoghania sp. L-A4]|nr:DNA-binding protein [Breoghania sp. L-A4]
MKGRAAYTPDEIAARWGCSANTVRAMIRSGELPGFKLGGRLYRVPINAVEEREKCEPTGRSSTEESGVSSITTTWESAIDLRLARMTGR